MAYIAAARGDAGPCDGGRAEKGEKLSAKTCGLWSSPFLRAPAGRLSPPPNPRPEPESTCQPPPAFLARGREAVLQTGVGLKARPPSSSRLRSTGPPAAPFLAIGVGVGLRGCKERFQRFLPALVQKTCVYQSGYRPGSHVPEFEVAALRAVGRRGASEEGPERFPPGPRMDVPRDQAWLTRPAPPHPALSPAPGTLPPRPAPHLPARPAPAVHSTAPHLPLAP